MTTYFITLDALGLKKLNHNKEISVSELIENAKKMCPHKELGCSFKTDDKHIIIQFIAVVIVNSSVTREVATYVKIWTTGFC